MRFTRHDAAPPASLHPEYCGGTTARSTPTHTRRVTPDGFQHAHRCCSVVEMSVVRINKQHLPVLFVVGLVAGCTGANGADGSACTVTENADGTATIMCEDGTSVTVADGTDGSDASSSLIVTTSEPAGANCASGGQRVDHGIDDDHDGTLDAEEIDGTVYVCNGTNGVGSVLDVTPEPPGGNCEAGGTRIDYGLDDNGNGTLETGEVDGTEFVCNGVGSHECYIDFAAGWASTGEHADPTTYYGSWGVTFVGDYGLIGGDANADPGNWDNVNEAWGIWSDGFAGSSTLPRQILFAAPAANVSFQIQRGFDDFTATVEGYRGGQLVETFAPSLAGGYDAETVTFTKNIDEIQISTASPLAYIIDDLAYEGFFSCPFAP